MGDFSSTQNNLLFSPVSLFLDKRISAIVWNCLLCHFQTVGIHFPTKIDLKITGLKIFHNFTDAWSEQVVEVVTNGTVLSCARSYYGESSNANGPCWLARDLFVR